MRKLNGQKALEIFFPKLGMKVGVRYKREERRERGARERRKYNKMELERGIARQRQTQRDTEKKEREREWAKRDFLKVSRIASQFYRILLRKK